MGSEPLAITQSAILRARVDPIWFAREVLGLKRKPGEPSLEEDPDGSWELDDWQIQLLEASADIIRHHYGMPTKFNHEGKTMISVRSCQGPGKTFGLALFVHWFGFCFQSLIACTAPKVQQVTTRLFKEFAKIQRRAGPEYSKLMEVYSGKIVWQEDPEWFAIAETGAQPENMQGFHGKYIAVLCDEASGVHEEVFPVMRGALSTGRVAIGLMTGNPTKNTGTFADSHRRSDLAGDYYLMHVSFENSRRVKRKWVEQMIRQYGPKSPAVLVRCYGEFADSDENQLIVLDWIQQARDRWADFDRAHGDGSIPYMRISADVADGGMDDTVITIARHYATITVLLRQLSYNYPPSHGPVMTAEEMLRLWESWGCSVKAGDDLVVDALGVGAGTAGLLMRKGLPVIAYKGGSGAENSERFRNLRVQSYIALRDALRDGQMVFADDFVTAPEWVEVESQLCSIQRKDGGERLEDLVTKLDMKRDGLKSPDRADSIAMQMATRSPALEGLVGGMDLMAVETETWSNY